MASADLGGGREAQEEPLGAADKINFVEKYIHVYMSCAKNHDIERRREVVKLPRAREKEREEDTICSVVHNIFSRDVISEIHTRESTVLYVTLETIHPPTQQGLQF